MGTLHQLLESASSEQDTTNKKLDQERVRTDVELQKSEASIQTRADAVALKARQTADSVLNVAREQEDVKLDEGQATRVARDAVTEARTKADSVLNEERNDADRNLQKEREQVRNVVSHLLGAERDETDSALLAERVSQLEQLYESQVAIDGLTSRLEAQSQAVERASRSRDSFLTLAAHELKTPLSALKLQVQSLLREGQTASGTLPTAVLRRLAVTERHVKRLESLTGRLLEASALEKEALGVQRGPLDLSALVPQIVRRLDALTGKGAYDVKLDVEPGVTGMWNRDQLERIVTSLLDNATRFGAGKPITVRLKTAGTVVRLSVEDHGIGISPADHDRIFQRFERAVSEKNYGGFGLGLWIVKRLATALGATVNVSSNLGAGAVFTVELPVDPVSE